MNIFMPFSRPTLYSWLMHSWDEPFGDIDDYTRDEWLYDEKTSWGRYGRRCCSSHRSPISVPMVFRDSWDYRTVNFWDNGDLLQLKAEVSYPWLTGRNMQHHIRYRKCWYVWRDQSFFYYESFRRRVVNSETDL